VLGLQLDSIILRIFSNPINDSMIVRSQAGWPLDWPSTALLKFLQHEMTNVVILRRKGFKKQLTSTKRGCSWLQEELSRTAETCIKSLGSPLSLAEARGEASEEANTGAELFFSIPLVKKEGHEQRKNTKDMSRMTRSLNCRGKIRKRRYKTS